jgi:hypothetical protein
VTEKHKTHSPVQNEISDDTGQFDVRFLLWREYCEQYGVPIATLPSDLNDEQKSGWEELKRRRLGKPE